MYFPNELEHVISLCPGVVECAVIGIADDKQDEAIKVFVVRSDAALTEDVVHAYCKQHLTNYKRPNPIEFRDDPPKTHVEKKFSDEHRVRRFDAFHARAF